MPRMKKFADLHFFLSKKLPFLAALGMGNCFFSRKKLSAANFSTLGKIFPPYRNIYSRCTKSVSFASQSKSMANRVHSTMVKINESRVKMIQKYFIPNLQAVLKWTQNGSVAKDITFSHTG